MVLKLAQGPLGEDRLVGFPLGMVSALWLLPCCS